jgi:hypothetical protein
MKYLNSTSLSRAHVHSKAILWPTCYQQCSAVALLQDQRHQRECWRQRLPVVRLALIDSVSKDAFNCIVETVVLTTLTPHEFCASCAHIRIESSE